MVCRAVAAIAVVLSISLAQAQTGSSTVGTIAGVRAETGEIDYRPDNAPAIIVKVTPETGLQRVPPGAKNLKDAASIAATDIQVGDRVLVTLKTGSQEARRIVVMPAAAIAQRNEAGRLDWLRRGVTGVVASRNGGEIVLRIRSFMGETRVTVTAGETTVCRRYAPDSVKFSDAKPSTLAEISAGDQLRARGPKSADGLTVAAEEIVFGTFLTRAGPITAVNAEAKEITVTDLATNKELRIRLTADSQLKRMPDLGAMPAPAGPTAAAMPAGGPPDFSQMLEHMPPATIESLKPGEMIVVSSTRGADAREATAIMLLANAGTLIRMASAQSGTAHNPAMPGGSGVSGGVMGINGLSGLELPGMIP